MKPVLALSLLLLATTARAADSTYTEFLTTSRTQFEAKNYDAARATMQSALDVAKTPDEKVGALLRIAKTFSEQKDFGRAREFYAQAAAQPGISDADKLDALFNIGASFHQAKQLGEAQKSFESLLADPLFNNWPVTEQQTNKEVVQAVRYNLGQVLLESGQADKGRALLSSVGDSDAIPFVRASAWLEVARSFNEQKMPDAARIAADKALAVPNAPLVLQANAYSARIEAFKAQNNAASAQEEKNKFLIQMLGPMGTTTNNAPTFGRAVPVLPTLDAKKPADLPAILEHLSAALFLVDGDGKGPQEPLSFMIREKIAETFHARGDIPTARAGWNELLGYFAPDSKISPELRANPAALVWQNIALWQLAQSYEATKDLPHARATWQRLVELPTAQPAFKDLAQKKLAAK